jgi:hypothetical protein
MPDGYDARMIAPDSIHLALEGKPEIKAHTVYGHGYFSKYGQKRSWRSRKLRAKFDRQALIQALDGTTGKITLNVTGLISPQVPAMISSNVDYVNFSGAGTIEVYEKKPKFRRYRLYLLKQIMRFFLNRG